MRLPQQSRQKYTSTATMLFQGKDNNNNNKQIPKGTHPYDTINLSTGEQYYIPINV